LRISKLLCLLLLTVLLFSFAVPLQAAAAEAMDPDIPVSLTITYTDKGEPLTEAVFSVYRVATMDKNGRFTLTAPFSGYNLDLSSPTDAAWAALATTLEGYVLRDKILPTATGKTDEEGNLTLPTGSGILRQGLYLVVGQRHTQNGMIYETCPFLLHLPTLSEESGEWIYDNAVHPKHESTPDNDEPITRKVLKVWEDDGYEKQRPKDITVQLLRDGEVYDTVILNAENEWRYTWDELDADYHWTVAEKELEDYTVLVTQEGVTFVITNSFVPPTTPPPPTPTPPTPPPRLPQTGQLWWPVPVLLVLGLFFVATGLLRRKDS